MSSVVREVLMKRLLLTVAVLSTIGSIALAQSSVSDSTLSGTASSVSGGTVSTTATSTSSCNGTGCQTVAITSGCNGNNCTGTATVNGTSHGPFTSTNGQLTIGVTNGTVVHH